MKFRLIEEAGDIWHRLWSVRLSLIASGLAALAAGMPFAAPAHRSLGFAVATGMVTLAASIAALAAAGARVVQQPKLAAEASDGPDAT